MDLFQCEREDFAVTSFTNTAAAEKVSGRLQGKAWAFWPAHALDNRHGGFVERFTLAGRADDPGFKRCRVTARQLYVFSHAAILGYAGAHEVAEAGYRYLIDRFCISPGRWARRVSTQGVVIDLTQDLYDLAFVLFALAWWAKASGDLEPIRHAEGTLLALRSSLSHPSGEGYLQFEGANAPYEQNPHMHLLEAMLFLAQESRDSLFLEEASSLYRLARDRFIGGAGTLAESYEPDWRRPEKVRVEPGHHFEWTWILKRFHDLTGSAQATQLAGTLFDFAISNGVDPRTGLVHDAVDPSGAILEHDHRIWPQLEAIKAWIAIAEIRGIDPSVEIGTLVRNIFDHYLDPGHPGLWIDHVTADLKPRVEFAPTSTFYHVFLSFSELLKFAGPSA